MIREGFFCFQRAWNGQTQPRSFGKSTQPRRIAAITIAHRIASEIEENLGRSVGYKIRFRDRTSPDAYIKILTDGMLLAETQSDPRLSAYDTLIIDEAHKIFIQAARVFGRRRKIGRILLPASSRHIR